MFDIRFGAPAPGLQGFVRFYIHRRARIGHTIVAHPVPARATPMIEFDFADQVDVHYANHDGLLKSPTSVIVGPQTWRRVEMRLQGSLDSFVIMFQPDGLHRLFSIPMHDLTDQDYDAHAVLGAFTSTMRQRLGECTSFPERIGVVDDFLLRQSLRSRPLDGISSAARAIMLSGGRGEMAALAATANLGQRQFERRFVDQVGMRPKLFARIVRFEAALNYKARCTTQSWTDVAHRFGYYDHMHMVHDFADFTGETPSNILQKVETVFVAQLKAIRSGNRSASDTASPNLML